MKKILMDLFSESSRLSMVRLESLIVVVTACYLAVSKGPEEIAVISILLTTGFGAKVCQKFAEIKGKQQDESADNTLHNK